MKTAASSNPNFGRNRCLQIFRLPNSKSTSILPSAAGRVAEENEIFLLDLLIVFAERKRIILGVTAVLAIIVSLVFPPRYTVTGTLLPPRQGGAALALHLGSMDDMVVLAGDSLGLKNANNASEMFVSTLKSLTVEDAMKRTEQKMGLIQLDSQACAMIESAASFRAQAAAKEVQIQGMRTYATGGEFAGGAGAAGTG
jgi:LPS O-antigen subunit length determinant protein (WzzB/FepE family)